MFIYVMYTDNPELSAAKRSSDLDSAVERSLLVNPKCPVRIMLEYIRNRCKLGKFSNFDLCAESGATMGLFTIPTYAYATDQFEHKRTYYIVVIRQERDKLLIFPQLNHNNPLYPALQSRVRKYLTTGEVTCSSSGTQTSVKTAASKITRKKAK